MSGIMQEALEQLEQSFIVYIECLLGDKVVIDTTKSTEERLIFLAELLDSLI